MERQSGVVVVGAARLSLAGVGWDGAWLGSKLSCVEPAAVSASGDIKAKSRVHSGVLWTHSGPLAPGARGPAT